MKKLNKFLTAILSLSITMSAFVLPVRAESGLTYTPLTQTAGIADGTVTIPANEAATFVNLYWGDENGVALEDCAYIHKFIKEASDDYPTAKVIDFSATDITYIIDGSRYLPHNAKTLVAEYLDDGSNVLSTISCAIPDDNQHTYEKPNYSMFWISDVHSQNYSYKTTSNQYNAFTVMKAVADSERANGVNFKGTIINGDIANSGLDYEYEILEDIMVENEIDFPVYYTNGNHDTSMFGYEACADAMDYRFEKLREEHGITFTETHAWSYDTYIEGQHYIFLAIPNGTSYSLSAAQAKWLETKICESANSGIPTYIFSHVPAYGMLPGGHYGNAFNVNTESAAFKDIVKKYPEVVFITSHVHNNLYCDYDTVKEIDGVTYVDTSAVYNTNVYTYPDDPTKKTAIGAGGSQGRYVMVYDDKIVIRSINFKNSLWIPNSEYVIPVDVSKKFDGTPSISYSNLSVGSQLTAKLDGADINTDIYSCEWFVEGTSVGTGTTYTVETQDLNVALKVTSISDGTYAYASTSYFDYKADEDNTGEGDGTLDVPEITYTNDNTVTYDGDIIYLEGDAGSANAGKTVTLVIAPKNAYTDASNIKYINDCIVGSDGKYVFKFKADLVSEDDFLMAKIQSENVTNSIISAKSANELHLEMLMTLDSTNTPVLSIRNKYKDAENVKVIIATYTANNVLIKADMVDYKMAFGEFGQQQIYNHTEAVTGNTVKAFIWKGIGDITPLAISKLQTIPSLESTEDVTE